jgi:hypothetical protein
MSSMEQQHTDTPQPSVSAPMRGVAVASVSLGFFSLLVFWWFPFGLFLSIIGLTIGVVSWVVGLRGGSDGENFAQLGTILCVISLTLILTIRVGLHVFLMDR